MLHDPQSAGNAMSLEFLDSYMNYKPPIAINQFKQCPVLLTQPEQDHWTPLALSQPVLKQLSVAYDIVFLPQGGHYPLEQTALDALVQASAEFIEKNK